MKKRILLIEQDALAALWQEVVLTEAGYEVACATGTLDRVRSLAHDYARRAKASLNGSDSEYARALLTVPDFILEREN